MSLLTDYEKNAVTNTFEPLTPESITAHLQLEPIPVEGGRFAQTWQDAHSSAIYFMITVDDFSGLHSLPFVEVWSFHAGAPTSMLLLYPDGHVEEPVLGIDLAGGQRPQVVVAPGVLMAAETLGDWSLLGTYMSPPYDEHTVHFCSGADAARRYPSVADRIRRTARA